MAQSKTGHNGQKVGIFMLFVGIGTMITYLLENKKKRMNLPIYMASSILNVNSS